jgi:hypothetical protein
MVMKTSLKLFQAGLMLLAFTAFYSCEKNNEGPFGSAEFSVALPGDVGQLKSGALTDSTTVAYQLLVSIQDLAGNPVLTDKLIPLYAFGPGFLSEKIEIRAGEFKLVKFMVINPSGTVIYAAPMAGSPLAYLTTKPLPFRFSVAADQVTQIVPEVLLVGDNTPDKFGYAAFGVSLIKPLVFWAGAVIDNPMIMAPFPQFTEAKLTVWATDGWHYSFKLAAGVNMITIRGGSEFYKFILEKEGFIPQKFEFTGARLRETSKEAPLYLKIPWDAVAYQKFVLQPGPEAGKDAMVSNLEPDKNFGGHKYFEATFLSEPVLTVMRLNRSLIEFRMPQTFAAIKIHKVKLKLSYEVPIPWDSTIFLSNSNTNFIGGVLQQVIEPWEENVVTWNKQPKTIEANQVFIEPFIRNVNFIEIDVTRLFVQPVSTDPAVYPNHGMLFRLWPEDRLPGFRFASSDHPNAALRPMLTVYYTNM